MKHIYRKPFTLSYLAIIAITILSCKPKHTTDEPITETVQEVAPPKPLIYHNIEITPGDTLTIYYPQFDTIDLVCQKMPQATDESIIFCCSAAFTGELLKEFKHTNIAGNHVSGGEFYRGYGCKANTGCFTFNPQNRSWTFAVGDYNKHVKQAAQDGGMAFGQAMIIHQGEANFKGPVKPTSKNKYRALCELNGQLCIIDATNTLSFQEFTNSLLQLGVTHALYLDMGKGWNFSYYRDNNNQVNYIHNISTAYATNWLVFKKAL